MGSARRYVKKKDSRFGGGGLTYIFMFDDDVVIAVPSRFDPSVPAFKMFVLCGAAMVAEVNFKRKTGRLVKGWPGRIWCLIIFAIYGKPLVASWSVLFLLSLFSPLSLDSSSGGSIFHTLSSQHLSCRLLIIGFSLIHGVILCLG